MCEGIARNAREGYVASGLTLGISYSKHAKERL